MSDKIFPDLPCEGDVFTEEEKSKLAVIMSAALTGNLQLIAAIDKNTRERMALLVAQNPIAGHAKVLVAKLIYADNPIELEDMEPPPEAAVDSSKNPADPNIGAYFPCLQLTVDQLRKEAERVMNQSDDYDPLNPLG